MFEVPRFRRPRHGELVQIASEQIGRAAFETLRSGLIHVADDAALVVHQNDLRDRLEQRAPARLRFAQRAGALVEQLLDPDEGALAANPFAQLDDVGRLERGV